MDNNKIIELKNISKEFRIPHERRNSAKEYFLNFWAKNHYDFFYALSEINLSINKGEWIGIIGHNGCGKSTLLKLISGIYEPDNGEINIKGRIIPFLELGVGFNTELSARDNIFLNGTILGMTRKNISEKFNEIVDFADIRQFLDQKLKNFSSGMQVRLAFSIAIQSSGDIYLLDEILAVGDYEFQQKSRAVFESMKREGKTVILVSHDLDSIRSLCDKAVLLEHGKIKLIDKPSVAINVYTNTQSIKLNGNGRPRWESEYIMSKNFINYTDEHKKSINRKIDILKNGLDQKSKEIIDQIPERYQYIYTNNILNEKLFSEEEMEERDGINIEKYLRAYDLKNFEIPTFQFHNGLKFIPQESLKKLKNKDAIDAGAFDGDSAIILNKEYNFNKIYSFEPQKDNFSALISNIKRYDLNNVIPTDKGLSDRKGRLSIKSLGSASYVSDDGDQSVETISIDDFVNENELNVGLIKMNIEGKEFDAIVGATNTIKKFKPILLISIYHNGKDFFEIKPYIESIADDYNFMIRKLNPNHLTFETSLIAWPK